MFIVHSPRPSNGARALARALKGRKINLVNNRSFRSPDIVINWGDSECPVTNVLNPGKAIALASNKREAFLAMQRAGVSVPNFATRKEDVNWKGTTVVRHKLQGHSGEGIEIVEYTKDLPAAPLYVQYIKKEQEFRIHVGRRNGITKIIAIQRKARDRSVPDGDVNWQVRNHDNGFIFVRGDANPHPAVVSAASDALQSLGLDFGAVDIIWNAKEGKAYVLEINTAPGLEGQTVDDYADFFRGFSPARTERPVPRPGAIFPRIC